MICRRSAWPRAGGAGSGMGATGRGATASAPATGAVTTGAAPTEAGWGNYSLFLTNDGLLVGYLETADYQAALDAMAKTVVNERWQAEMSEFFVADGPPDESFTRIAEVFHLD